MDDTRIKRSVTNKHGVRLRFTSAKQRSKTATADVYRKKKTGDERRIHHHTSTKKRLREECTGSKERGDPFAKQIIFSSSSDLPGRDESTTVASELDQILERNGSLGFAALYRELWPLVRSLPEVLHHLEQIVEISSKYLLDDKDSQEELSLATPEVLYLWSVLARQVRQELDPHLEYMVHRLLHDVLPIACGGNGQQQQQMNVTMVEALFRTLSYLFRYTRKSLTATKDSENSSLTLDSLRQYYGLTLGHRRPLVRRLAAETFAPLVRHATTTRTRHVLRVLRAVYQQSLRSVSSSLTQQQRLQDDMVDGISAWLLEIGRGVAGQLHRTVGPEVVPWLLQAMIKNTCCASAMNYEDNILYRIAATTVGRLAEQVKGNVSVLLSEILKVARQQLDNTDAAAVVLCHVLPLLTKLIEQQQQLSESSTILVLIHQVLSCKKLHSDCLPLQVIIFQLVCRCWSEEAYERLNDVLLETLVASCQEEDDDAFFQPKALWMILLTDGVRHARSIKLAALMKNMLLQAASGLLVSSNKYRYRAVAVVHALSCTSLSEPEEIESDQVVFLDQSTECRLPRDAFKTLLSKLRDSADSFCKTDNVTKQSKILLVLQATSFVAALSGDSTLISETAQWDVSMLAGLDGLAKSRALETCALLCQRCDECKKTLNEMESTVADHLQNYPASLWALKAAACFCEARNGSLLASARQNPLLVDEFFEALVPNLSDRSHFRRLYTLQILSRFPKKQYVLDHSDLDLSEDLDEEPMEGVVSQSQPSSKTSCLSGASSLLDSLLALESTPVSVSTERTLSSLISRVAVECRSGRLPIIYADAASHHLVGFMHVPFSPLWKILPKTMAEICGRNKDNVFGAVWRPLINLMTKVPCARKEETQEFGVSLYHPLSFSASCAQWEDGASSRLFQNNSATSTHGGRVSRHRCTDDETVLEQLWKVLEERPQLVMDNSKLVVGCMVNFFYYQHFVSSSDPDAQELKLEMLVTPDDAWKTVRCSGDLVSRRAIHNRLLSILRTLSAVTSPRQLYLHQLLYRIHMSLLAHSDGTVGQLALSCVLRYKPQHLLPHREALSKLYGKFEMREALLQLRESVHTGEGEDIRPDMDLLLALSRIFIGRASARAQGRRTSKDTPAARRQAVMSCLASMTREEEDLYPMFYLMVRPYLTAATEFSLKPLEDQTNEYRAQVVMLLGEIQPEDCTRLPVQLHQGFLNSLDAFLSQFGHAVRSFIPSLVSILLALLKSYEIGDRQTETDSEEEGHSHNAYDGSEIVEANTSNSRDGVLRALCFRRLSTAFEIFSDALDLVSMYKVSLWDAVHKSLAVLPQMAVHAEKPPALLNLIRTLSSKAEIFASCDMVLPSIIRCLDAGSKQSVVEVCLSVIENLLGECDKEDNSLSLGPSLIREHMTLLLDQFRNRLEGGTKDQPQSRRKELDILCRVSSFIEDVHGSAESENSSKLCRLLIPYLEHDRRSSDMDKANVLGILKALLPRVPSEVAADFYNQLSRLLGTSGITSGIKSKPVRQLFSETLHIIASCSDQNCVKATCTLKKICSVSNSKVDEIDFDTVIPALGDLGSMTSSSSWLEMCKVEGGYDPRPLQPVLYCLFHLLFCEDGVVARTSFRALRALVAISSERLQRGEAKENEEWTKLLTGSVVPSIYAGLRAREQNIRRFYVLLIKDVALCNKASSNPHLHGDLSFLVREDELDLDFFANITHVQIHRRGRAFQRLRKNLLSEGECRFSTQSISHVLLPIALHPVYETKTKAEDIFALEGIATVGALTRHLSWSKYNTLFSSTLSQFHRHPEQEAYLVGLICALLDSFHFDVEGASSGKGGGGNAVWRTLDRRFIPRLEELLVKQKVDRNGEKMKTLRPSIVLAMVKLFQKLSTEALKSRLPRLLTVICDALKSRESDGRDVARTTLAKIAATIDLAYFADIVRELAVTLCHGYQLHVRIASIHTILQKLAEDYQPDKHTPEMPFDNVVPAIMDLVQQDLFGEAQERKDAEGKVRFVKEASGSKSTHCLELVASMIVFQPSPTDSSPRAIGVHVLVSPLLERLRDPSSSTKVVRKVKECLSRIVAGLRRNPTVHAEEVLTFTYATLKEFVTKQDILQVLVDEDYDSDSEEEDDDIQVSGTKKVRLFDSSPPTGTRGSTTEWRPSILGLPQTAEEAQAKKKKEKLAMRRVADGASAPKLTGSGRHGATPAASLNDPSTINAVVFTLQLLSSSLKKIDKQSSSLLNPMVPLLTTCSCRCRDAEVTLLSLKCLGAMLRSDLPSVTACAPSLATKALDLLISSGAALNSNPEMLQASFRMLTQLLLYDDRSKTSRETESMDSQLSEGNLVLDAEQMKVLLSFLKASVMDCDQHNPAMSLIKVIMARKVLTPELYDLMETLVAHTVRSTKSSLRDQCSSALTHFLLNYPLSEEKVVDYVQQLVLNLQYEHSEGRLSAINLISSLLEKFPGPFIEKYYEILFLPMAMQLANDTSDECREALTKGLSKLLYRLSKASLNILWDYTLRWANSESKKSLRLMALQLVGIFVDMGKRDEKILATVGALLQEQDVDDWQLKYFALIDAEKLQNVSPSILGSRCTLWQYIVEAMRNKQHPWVQLVASRLLVKEVTPLDPSTFGNDCKTREFFLVQTSGLLYTVVRSFCAQLSVDDAEQHDDLLPWIVRGLTWAAQAMKAFPKLCFDTFAHEEQNDPVLWLLTRLSNIAKPHGTKRRQAVYKCLASLSSKAPTVVLSEQRYLELILEPLYRSSKEHEEQRQPSLVIGGKSTQTNETMCPEEQLASEVLQLVEDTAPDELFLASQVSVQKRSRDKAAFRKEKRHREVVLDPEAAAGRRIKKQQREKDRRKRRVDDKRRAKGVIQGN